MGPTSPNRPDPPSLRKYSSLQSFDSQVADNESKLCMLSADQLWFKAVILFLLCMLPFGGLLAISSLATFECFFIADPNVSISPATYGLLMSAAALPNLFVPFLAGGLFDSGNVRVPLIVCLLVTWFGEGLLVLSISRNLVYVCVFAQVLFGAGQGCIIVAQRTLISRYFGGRELVFAIGAAVSVGAVARSLGRATPAPIAAYTGDYMVALWGVYYVIGVSVFAGMLFSAMDAWAENSQKDQKMEPGEPMREAEEQFHMSCNKTCSALNLLQRDYWLVVLVHCLFALAFSLFFNISTHLVSEYYELSVVTAGLYSSLQTAVAVLLAPMTGLIIDRTGGQLFVCIAAGVMTVLGLGMLGLKLNPLVSLGLLGVGEAIVPTISLALVPSTCTLSLYGVGFGVVEVIFAFGAFVGNSFVGALREMGGSYSLVLLTLGGLCVLGLFLLILLFHYDATVLGGRLNARMQQEKKPVALIATLQSFEIM